MWFAKPAYKLDLESLLIQSINYQLVSCEDMTATQDEMMQDVILVKPVAVEVNLLMHCNDNSETTNNGK